MANRELYKTRSTAANVKNVTKADRGDGRLTLVAKTYITDATTKVLIETFLRTMSYIVCRRTPTFLPFLS